MAFDPARHHRRSIRLQGYDYSRPGAYFVTICTQKQEYLFGEIVGVGREPPLPCTLSAQACAEMRLNDAGFLVMDSWAWLASRYDQVELDEFVIMPNHMHGILVINNIAAGSRTAGFDQDSNRGGSRIAPTTTDHRRKPVGRLIGAFKTVSTKRHNELRQTPGAKLWQRNYWEHIIRDEPELHRIREYIRNNPAQWEFDKLNYPRGI